ncbi:MAG: signal peptidase II [Deltaproteobacteria bacterium]|nr:signal peptidase II [Deltaproteobacteria bacterium]
MSRFERLLILSLLLLGTIACDQSTKRVAQIALEPGHVTHYLGDTVRLQLAENPGAFLSLGAMLSVHARFAVFTVGVSIVLLGMLAWAVTTRRITRLQLVGCALIVGGGASNLADRVFAHGRVVDFMNLGVGGLRTGIFNVADVAIMIGVAALVLRPRALGKSASVT